MKKDDKDTKFKPAEIKLDFKNLPPLKPAEGYNLPKPPSIDGRKKERKQPFSLASEYDISTYWGRF